MNLLLIINPNAGKGNLVKHLPQINSFFSNIPCSLEVYKTQKRGDALKKAKSSAGKYDIIIAAGGDGTINEVVNGIAGSKTKLGIIPIGTTNVFAKEMKIPSKLMDACKVIANGKSRKIDLGKVNGHYFLQWAGIGFDASVLAEVQPLLKKLLGIGAYTIAACKKLIRYNSPLIHLAYDNKEISAYFVIVSNIKSYGHFFHITPSAEIDDGYLDVCLFKDKIGLKSLLRYAPKITMQKKICLSNLTCFKAKSLKISSSEKVMVQVDGDIICNTPIDISVVPRSLEIICP